MWDYLKTNKKPKLKTKKSTNDGLHTWPFLTFYLCLALVSVRIIFRLLQKDQILGLVCILGKGSFVELCPSQHLDFDPWFQLILSFENFPVLSCIWFQFFGQAQGLGLTFPEDVPCLHSTWMLSFGPQPHFINEKSAVEDNLKRWGWGLFLDFRFQSPCVYLVCGVLVVLLFRIQSAQSQVEHKCMMLEGPRLLIPACLFEYGLRTNPSNRNHIKRWRPSTPGSIEDSGPFPRAEGLCHSPIFSSALGQCCVVSVPDTGSRHKGHAGT